MKNKSNSMVRKITLMSPKLIARIECIAKNASIAENRHISFAEIVRRALSNYNPTPSKSEEKLLEALLDSVIKSTNDTVKSVRQLNQKLDASYIKMTSGLI